MNNEQESIEFHFIPISFLRSGAKRSANMKTDYPGLLSTFPLICIGTNNINSKSVGKNSIKPEIETLKKPLRFFFGEKRTCCIYCDIYFPRWTQQLERNKFESKLPAYSNSAKSVSEIFLTVRFRYIVINVFAIKMLYNSNGFIWVGIYKLLCRKAG